MANESCVCPHCGKKMSKWRTPAAPFTFSSWGGDFLYVCFNDECPYFVQGWQWMWEKFQRKASYRCMCNQATGKIGALAVASYSALKDGIIDG